MKGKKVFENEINNIDMPCGEMNISEFKPVLDEAISIGATKIRIYQTRDEYGDLDNSEIAFIKVSTETDKDYKSRLKRQRVQAKRMRETKLKRKLEQEKKKQEKEMLLYKELKKKYE